MKNLNELNSNKTKEEMDAEAIRQIDEITESFKQIKYRLEYDPEIIAGREEYARRKAAVEWPDED
jgi:hypothetical protein